MKAELTKELDAILGSTALNASVLAQQIEDGNVEELAESLNITTGKAALVKNIADANSAYKAEDLAELSVNELNLVLSNSKNDVKNVVSTGEANDDAYIGKDKAKAAAFKHAKVDEKSVRDLEIEMDFEYGAMVYEVDFASEEFEYDYSIDAKKGEVVHSHKEVDDDYVAPVKEEKPAEVKDIGKDKAKAVAFDKAGVKESEVKGLVIEKEKEDGKYEYHVEFRVGSKEYDVDIAAETGKVLDYDVDVDDDKKASSSSTSSTTKKEEKPAEVKDIGKDKAKAVAFDKAGVKESEVKGLVVEKEKEDGKYEYHVEFRVGSKEYDVEIAAETGKVLDYDVDVDDDKKASSSSSSSTTKQEEKPAEVKDIGKDKAKAVAFDKAGVKSSDVKGLVIEKEKDDGKYEYHVEFRVGSKEYDVEISAETGKVLSYDVDVDDDKKASSSSSSSTTKQEEKPAEAKDIGKDKAKSIALEKAGVKESKVSNLVIKKEKDNGKYEYHVEFRSGNKEYDFEISAETGKILDYDVEVEEEKPVEKPVEKEESTNDIGKEKAKSIALSHAGLKESQVTKLEVERDVDDGKIEYSVEFKADGKEYSYEISGTSGKILDYESERDDD